jgi:hypothetical protein
MFEVFSSECLVASDPEDLDLLHPDAAPNASTTLRSEEPVKGQHPHTVAVLRRGEVRERAGDLTALEALDRLRAHAAAAH